MFDGISRIYSGQLQPIKPNQQTDKKDPVSAGTKSEVSSLVPELKDKVEISDEGRRASKTGGLIIETTLPPEDFKAVTENWYSTGYRIAQDLSDSM